MKKNKVIIILIVLILIVVSLDFSLIVFKIGKKKDLNSINKEEIKIVTYQCTKNKPKIMKNNKPYVVNVYYEFIVAEENIEHGSYEEILKFNNAEDYNWYRDNQEIDTIFTKEYDLENFILKYKRNMILKDDTIAEGIKIKDYINFLEIKKELQCSLVRESYRKK